MRRPATTGTTTRAGSDSVVKVECSSSARALVGRTAPSATANKKPIVDVAKSLQPSEATTLSFYTTRPAFSPGRRVRLLGSLRFLGAQQAVMIGVELVENLAGTQELAPRNVPVIVAIHS